MHTIRLFTALVWLLTSSMVVGTTASACDHGADDTAMTGHAAMMTMDAATAAHDMAGRSHDHGDDHGCVGDCSEGDCCEGACLCEGLTAPAAAVPPAGSLLPAVASAISFAPSAKDWVGHQTALEGPPPRLF